MPPCFSRRESHRIFSPVGRKRISGLNKIGVGALPSYGTTPLQQTLTDIQQLGYTFVSPSSL